MWPSQEDAQYYGRGPFMMTWNWNYGRFSNVFAADGYDSKMYLLKNPDLVHLDGEVAMAAGIWVYMTPQNSKPSMHDVMTGFFNPTEQHTSEGIDNGFGTTINIISGSLECNNGLFE